MSLIDDERRWDRYWAHRRMRDAWRLPVGFAGLSTAAVLGLIASLAATSPWDIALMLAAVLALVVGVYFAVTD